MKLHINRVSFFIILLITLIGLNSFVQGQAGSFTQGNWLVGEGNHINTTTDGDNITLNFTNISETHYYSSGVYEQDINGFDAGKIVNWTNISWIETVDAIQGENILMEVAFSDDIPGNGWGGWTFQADDGFGNFQGVGNLTRHIRYKAQLQTGGENTTTPFLESVTISYTEIAPQVFNQEPQDGAQTTDGNIDLNCSASEDNLPGVVGLENMTLYWNYSGDWEANETQQVSGQLDTVIFSKTDLVNGEYKWNCLVYNNNTDFAWGENRTFTVSLGGVDTTPPVINSVDISPSIVLVGQNVSLNISATDNLGLIHSLWANITLPDSTTERITLINNNVVNYAPQLIGTYTVVFYVNDTAGNEVNTTDSFEANEMKTFNVSVLGPGGVGLNSTFVAFMAGETTEEINESSEGGNFTNFQLIGGIYDFLFKAFSEDIQVKLKGINISANLNRTFGMDKLGTSVAGFGEAYAVDNTYIISSATVKIFYIQSNFLNEDHISVQECDNWSFSGRNCLGNWADITASHDATNNFFEFDVSSFSGFGIIQNSFCGDDVCDESETSTSCPGDCQCSENETRQCGSDVGECSYGVESCVDGAWSACIGDVGPVNETCNQEDDDCNGVVDNVNGGNSISSASCQCYDGASPLDAESCNAIDDNCDGQIDEGVTAPCGNDVGACSMGIKVCVNGVFGEECTGVGPVEEICGNAEDDDCDNETDEFCASCTNQIQDGDEDGVDCGGSCADDCFVFPLDLFIILAAIIGIAVVAVFVAFKFFKGREVTWEAVEEKYGTPY